MPTYAPTYLTGKIISATVATVDLAIKKSSASAEVNEQTVTNKKSAGYHEVAPGIKKWTASLSIVGDSAVALSLSVGDYVACVVAFTGSRTYTGSAMIKKVGDDGDIEGDYTINLELTGSGPFTVA